MKAKFTLIFFWLFFLVVISANSQVAPTFKWFDSGSSSGNVNVTDVVPVPDGSFLAAGTFMGESITFGNITITGFRGGEGNSVFIVRYDKNGNLLWARSVYFSSLYWANVYIKNIVLQPDFSPVLILGGNGDTLFLPDGKFVKMPSEYEINVLMKLSLDGGNQTAVNYLWATNGFIDVSGVDIDREGNLVLCGQTNGDGLYFSRSQTEPITLQGGNYYQSYLVKYDNMLNLPLWSHLWRVQTMAAEVNAKVVKVDPLSQNIIMGGYYRDTIWDASNSMLISSGSADIFLTGFDKNGNKLFLISGGGEGDDYVDNLIFDNAGNYYVAGASSSTTISFPGYVLYGLAGDGVFDAFGLKFIKDNLSQVAGSVVINNNLNYYTPGYTPNKIKYIKDTQKIIWLTTFRSPTLVAGQLSLPKVTPTGAASYPEYAVLCLDPESGQFLWGQNFGYNIEYEMHLNASITSNGVYFSLPLDAYSNLYLTGGKILSNGVVNSTGFAIFHIGVDGSLRFEKTILPNSTYDSFNGLKIALLRSGKILVAGIYNISDVYDLDGISVPSTLGSYFFVATLGYGIQGTVYTPSQQPVTKGTVKLFGINTDTRGIEIDKVDINASGKYEFTSVPSAGFVIYAEPDPEKYPDLMGAYYGNMSRWINVPIVDLSVTILPAYDIYLKARPALTGANSANGSVTFADDYFFDITKRLKSIKGKPVKSASVVLVGRTKGNGENIIAQTYTDDYGSFAFSNIPDGSYTVIVDIPGYQHKQFFDFDVTGGQGVSGIHYLVTEEGIILRPLGIKDPVSTHNFRIYPNPASGVVAISARQPGNYLVELFSLSGQKVTGTTMTLNEGESRMELTGIAPGVYHLRISGNNNTFNSKLIVQ